MDKFRISYNYLKTVFERKKVPFPKELATILEPPAITMTKTQSPNNSTATNMYNDDERDNTEDRSLDESSDSNYTEEYDYPLIPINILQSSSKGLQEHILG